MASKAQYNPLTSQVTLTVLTLAAFSLAMVVGFGFFATLKTDQDSLEKQKTFVTTGIADETAELVRQQTSVTVWDDSVVAARNGDQAWMAENLGEWMHSYYGQDRVYVLDRRRPADPRHARRQDACASAYEDDRAAIEPSVAKLRALISDAADVGKPAPLVVSD